jgi:hypothetical protein
MDSLTWRFSPSASLFREGTVVVTVPVVVALSGRMLVPPAGVEKMGFSELPAPDNKFVKYMPHRVGSVPA